MSDQVRIAVGLGYWGRISSEISTSYPEQRSPAWRHASGALEKIAARYPAVQQTTSFEHVLEDSTIDAVLISTPVSTHYELAERVLRSGKHAFVEKPLATSTVEAVALTELAESLGLVLMPGHTFLYSPAVNVIRDLICSGDLGEIFTISTSRVNLGLHQSDVSVTWDLAPHDFSILRYWLDETPTHVTALSRGCIMPSTPDVAFIHLNSSRKRSPTSSSRGSHRASFAYDDHRFAQDGGLRRREHRAGTDLRFRRDGA